MISTKVRIIKVTPSRHSGARTEILSGWMNLTDAQVKMGEWSYFISEDAMLIIRDRFGRQQGLGLMGKVADLWS